MKIKSFKGRRLVADKSIEEVSENTGLNVAIITKIEAIEDAIKKLNDYFDNLKDEN